MSGHRLIDEYLVELASQLPVSTVDELADGLYETLQRHLSQGRTSEHAAVAAVAEFGTVRQVHEAFVARAPGRRIARLLLATGPFVGLCWGASLITAKVWTWPVPWPVGIIFGILLLGVVGSLLAAATSRYHYRRTRLGSIGAVALMLLDATMVTAVLLAAPNLVWPLAIAVAASLLRIGFTAHSVPRTYWHRGL